MEQATVNDKTNSESNNAAGGLEFEKLLGAIPGERPTGESLRKRLNRACPLDWQEVVALGLEDIDVTGAHAVEIRNGDFPLIRATFSE